MTTSTSADIEAAPLGATRLPGGDWQFLLWAPHARRVDLQILGPARPTVEMEKHSRGYYSAVIEGLDPGQQYLYRLDRVRDIPDPASRFQPEGVHGASQLVDPNTFEWTDQDWTGIPIERSIFYE